MRPAMKIFRIFGIDIQLHYSWWFVFAFLTWSLATLFFPHHFPDYSVITYWILGASAALLLFVSVLLHELSHSLVAKMQRIKVENITLFFFGGVSGITREDMRPKSEFLMAIAGPLFSFVLAGVFYLLYQANGHWVVTALSFYLYQLNLILGIFNLIPGFPLDGGRVFRAIIYGFTKNLTKATRVAMYSGRVVAFILIGLGLLSFFAGLGNGLWLILIGGFLYFAAGASYQQVLFKEVLGKVKVKSIMTKKVTKVSATMKFSDFVKKYRKSGKNTFVVKGKGFHGLLNLSKLGAMSVEVQRKLTVSQLALPLNYMKTLHLDDSAYKAFTLFARQRVALLPVVEGKKIVGVVDQISLMNRYNLESKFSSRIE